MQIPVLIEPVAQNGYRARGMEPFAVSAEGATREEALAKLRAEIESRLAKGAEVVGLERNAILVTRNVSDFQQVPGLRIEDWSK